MILGKILNKTKDDNGLKTFDLADDPPEFKRIYQVTIARGIKLEISANTWMIGRASRSYHGELQQQDGRTVWFEPEAPADRILDREILPDVQRWCREIIDQDRLFYRSKPQEFTDEAGTRWRRMKGPSCSTFAI